MNPLTLAVWLVAGGLVAFTARLVVRRIVAAARELATLNDVKDFIDAMSREVHAGAREQMAAKHAVDVVERAGMREELRIATGRIGLGEAVDVAAPSEPALRRLFAVWALAGRHGLAFGQLADLLVEDLETRLSQRSAAHSAMAGARLTEMVLLFLPVAAVAMGESMGMGSVELLFFNPLGSVLLLVGVLLACAGVWWTESLSVKALGGVGGRAGPKAKRDEHQDLADPLEAACLLDVFSASLSAGLPTSKAWALASTNGPPEASLVATLLELGAGKLAWESLEKHPMFGPVARQAAQQTRAGSALSKGARRHAQRLRQSAKDTAVANAEKILVTIAAPLTLCFLPAFIVVGLIPLVIGLAGI